MSGSFLDPPLNQLPNHDDFFDGAGGFLAVFVSMECNTAVDADLPSSSAAFLNASAVSRS